jgi:hypothetical protein
MSKSKRGTAAQSRLIASWRFETDAEGGRVLKVYAIENNSDLPSVVGELTLNLSNLEIAKVLGNGVFEGMLEAEFGESAMSDLRKGVIALLNKPPATVLKLVRESPAKSKETGGCK